MFSVSEIYFYLWKIRVRVKNCSLLETLDSYNFKTWNFSNVKFQFRKTPKPNDAVIICVSSRALFDMREGREIQDTKGLDSYIKYMVDNEDKPLSPGPAFGFVQALENVNLQLLKIDENEKNLFDVVLVSLFQILNFFSKF